MGNSPNMTNPKMQKVTTIARPKRKQVADGLITGKKEKKPPTVFRP
jgi:hypothetical protein